GNRALFGPILGTRSAVGGPEAIKPLPYRSKPALNQLRLGVPGQAVLWLNTQPDQYATTFRREVDAADLLVVFAVVHIEDLGNPKVRNPHSQCRADGVGARGGRPGRADDLTRPHIDHGGQPGPDRSIGRY